MTKGCYIDAVMTGSAVEEWRALKRRGRERFVAEFSHPFLVCVDWEDAIREEEEVLPFKTDVVTPEVLAEVRHEDLSRALIARVVKTDRNPYQVIHLGRAANCDIVLPHHSVSKLHASLSLVPGGAEVTDVGSRNGTFLRGERLPKGRHVLVRFGEELIVGRIPTRFLDAGRLFDLL